MTLPRPPERNSQCAAVKLAMTNLLSTSWTCWGFMKIELAILAALTPTRLPPNKLVRWSAVLLFGQLVKTGGTRRSAGIRRWIIERQWTEEKQG
jgi:hypothetical protein